MPLLKDQEVVTANNSLATSASPFTTIYLAALKQDAARIEEALQAVTIDVETSVDGAPISKLAFEGKIQAVEYLQKKFNASSRWAIYGYGRSVNEYEAKHLLMRARSYHEYMELQHQYLKGLAVCNNPAAQDVIKSVLANFSDEEKFACHAPLTCGYILGDHEAPEIRHTDGNFIGLEPKEVINAKISAWARTQNTDQFNSFFNQKIEEAYYISRNAHLDSMGTGINTFNYNECVLHYYYSLARLGLLDKALYALNVVKFGDHNEFNFLNFQTAIVRGLGRGGYYKKALDFIYGDQFRQRIPIPNNENEIDQRIIEDNASYRYYTVEELNQGLAKGGALERIKAIRTSLILQRPTVNTFDRDLALVFCQKGYFHEAKASLNSCNTWQFSMQNILDKMSNNIQTDYFQRTALELLIAWMDYYAATQGKLFFYSAKHEALKPKAMAIIKIMHHREFNFSQSLAWLDTSAMQILWQLSQSGRISIEPLMMVFEFMYPMPNVEKQEVLTKFHFLAKAKNFSASLSTQADFNPVVQAWERTPEKIKHGLTLFKIIKENNLLKAAAISLQLATEEQPKSPKLG